jgi:HipA-like protein
MTQRNLYVHYESKVVGVLSKDENDLLHFSYEDDWLTSSAP